MDKSKTEEEKEQVIIQKQTALQNQIEKLQAEIAEKDSKDALGPLGKDTDRQRAELAGLESQFAEQEAERLKNQVLDKAGQDQSSDSAEALDADSAEVNKENSNQDQNISESNKKANEEAQAAALAKKEEPLLTAPEDLVADAADEEEKDETPKPTVTKKDSEEEKLKEKEGTLARTMEVAAKFGEGPSLIGTAWDAAVNTKKGQEMSEALSDAKSHTKEWAGSEVQAAKDSFKSNAGTPDATPLDEPAPPNTTPRFDKPDTLGNETVQARNWDKKPEKTAADSPGIELSDVKMKPLADTSVLKAGPDSTVASSYDKALNVAASGGASKDSAALESDKENSNTPQMGMGQS